jgi:cysteine desulfurase / selenocysteine lyase
MRGAFRCWPTAARRPCTCRSTCRRLGVDFYAVTGHKLYGPSGSGAIYIRRDRQAEMRPFIGGGDMIREVTRDTVTWNDPPHKFEAGTPGIVQQIGLGVALEYMMALGMDAIAAHERDLTDLCARTAGRIELAAVQGTRPGKGAIFSFTMSGGAHAHDISTILDKKGVAVRAGQHCVGPLMDHLGINASCRASFAMYNTRPEVDALGRGVGVLPRAFCVRRDWLLQRRLAKAISVLRHP